MEYCGTVKAKYRFDKSKEKDIPFVSENFTFKFVNTEGLFSGYEIPVDESGYIWGKTVNQTDIAIFAGRNILVKSILTLNTSRYIIYKTTNHSFNMIQFENGILSQIYPCNALEKSNTDNADQYVYIKKKDEKKYTISKGDDNDTWIFTSRISESQSIDKGISLANSDSILQIEFDKLKTMEVFDTYWRHAYELICFLTYRRNCYFDKVGLYNRVNGINYLCADCYILKKSKNSFDKNYDSIIPIRYLSDENMDELLKNIYKIDKKHPGLPIEIIPQDINDFGSISTDTIKLACSLVEIEMNYKKLKIKQPPEVENVIKEVKNLLKEKKGSLSEKTYSMMQGSLEHWSQSTSERIFQCWMNHSALLADWLKKYEIEMTEQKVNEFVNARNDITHRGSAELGNEVCETTLAIEALIMCCVLERLKFSSKDIETILSRVIR